VTLTDNRTSDRQYQALLHILEGHHKAEDHQRRLRLRLAHEIGFDAKHPNDVKVGDRIRVKAAFSWFEVERIDRYEEDGRVYRRFHFPGQEGYWEVEIPSEAWPCEEPPYIAVLLPELDGEPF
jgi:hypothetical protein